MSDVYAKEEETALLICSKIGYGRVMQLAADRWAEIDPRGALTVGACKSDVKIEEAIARQLSRSMELNARMISRLRNVIQCWGCPTAVRDAIETILRDQDPRLNPGSQPSIYGGKKP